MILAALATARSGDKGQSANIGVVARSEAAYQWLETHLTAAVVESFFKPLGAVNVERYLLPQLHAMNFVLPQVLGHGGSRSLRVDAQGKALGQWLLTMDLTPFGEPPIGIGDSLHPPEITPVSD
jgi:hypothetical protein